MDYLLLTDGSCSDLGTDFPDGNWVVAGIGIEADEIKASGLLNRSPLQDATLVNLKPYSSTAQSAVMNYAVGDLHRFLISQLNDKAISSQGYDANLRILLSMPISELSPMRTHVFNQLYQLHIALELIGKKRWCNVFIQLKDTGLTKTIEEVMSSEIRQDKLTLVNVTRHVKFYSYYWIQVVRQAARFLMVRWTFRGISTTTNTKGKNAVFTVFPIWWANLTSSKPTDRFFPQLSSIAAEQRPPVMAWGEISLPHFLFRRVRLRNAAKSARLSLLQSFVTIADFLSLFSWHHFRSVCGLRSVIKKAQTPPFHGVDVSRLLHPAIESSFYSSEVILSELMSRALRNCVAKLKIRNVLFRFEAQPIDQIIIGALQGKAGSVGFWHSSMCGVKNYIPHILTTPNAPHQPKERNLFPDRFLSANDICYQDLVNQGICDTRIIPSSPLRQQALFNTLRRKNNAPLFARAKKPWLPVCLPVSQTEARGFFHCLVHAANSCGYSSLRVKPHPAGMSKPLIMELHRLQGGDLEIEFIDNQSDFMDLLTESQCFVSGGTTLAFEGLALGSIPIVYHSLASYPTIPFQLFTPALYSVSDSVSLITALKEATAELNFPSKTNLAARKKLLKNLNINKEIVLETAFEDALQKLDYNELEHER